MYKQRKPYHIKQIPPNQRPSSPQLVDKNHSTRLSKQSNNIINRLILQRITTTDPNRSIYSHGVILNGRDARHLHGRLESARDEESAEGGYVSEELHVGLCLVLVLEGYAFLDLVEFGANPGVGLVTVGVQAREGAETLFGIAVVNEPSLSVSSHTKKDRLINEEGKQTEEIPGRGRSELRARLRGSSEYPGVHAIER